MSGHAHPHGGLTPDEGHLTDGATVSLTSNPLNQHFAVALDSQLVTVPQIDVHLYPDGITGGGGADIAGGFTAQSARDLATELRYGALPLAVRVVR